MTSPKRAATAPEPSVQDLRLPGGCPTCGGELSVRVSPSGARGYCPVCARLSTALVIPAANGTQIVHLAAAA